MKKLEILDWIALVLVIVGGLNWGLVGALNFNLVEFLFGTLPYVGNIVYVLVGIAALYMIYFAYEAS